MATGSPLDEDLTCSICLEEFVQPKILPCAHRFCEKCLCKEILRSAEVTGEPGFLCPLCKRFISPPSNMTGTQHDQWGSNFPTDFVMQNIIDKVKADEPDDEGECDAESENCDKHGYKYKLYCMDCMALACHECAWDSHKSCTNVKKIASAVTSGRAMLKVSVKDIDHSLLQTHGILRKWQTASREFDQENTAVTKAVSDAAANAISCIKKNEGDILEALKNVYEGEKRKTTIVINQLKAIIKSMLDTKKAVKTTLETSKGTELLKNVKVARQFEKQIAENKKRILTGKEVFFPHIVFSAGEGMLDICKVNISYRKDKGESQVGFAQGNKAAAQSKFLSTSKTSDSKSMSQQKSTSGNREDNTIHRTSLDRETSLILRVEAALGSPAGEVSGAIGSKSGENTSSSIPRRSSETRYRASTGDSSPEGTEDKAGIKRVVNVLGFEKGCSQQ